MKFLTANLYSPLDVVWLVWFTLAWNDGLHVFAIAFAIAGGFLSGALTGWTNRRHAQRHGGRE
jgi:hypothetical protein